MRKLVTCCVGGAALVLFGVSARAAVVETDMTAGGTIIAIPTEPDAQPPASLGALLRVLDQRLGAKPVLGKIKTDKSKSIVVASFTADASSVHTAGLATVNVASGKAVALYDAADHFAQSETAMLQYLQDQYAPPADPVPKLTPVVFQDGSGAVSLPEGWKLARGASGSGAVTGPNGENIVLGVLIAAFDPTVPASKPYINQIKRSKTPSAMMIAPYDGDVAKAFLEINAALAQVQKIDPPKIDIISREPHGNSAVKSAVLRGTVSGGISPSTRSFVARVGLVPVSPATGMWGLTASEAQVPVALAAKDRPIVDAIFASYRVKSLLREIEPYFTPKSMDDFVRGDDPSLERANPEFADGHAAERAKPSIAWSELTTKWARLSARPRTS